ncbi:MAG: hypothetical protein FJ137_04710 [Deltaproteobacteria bacterium]|nr:hypothetical protein [Deltaproteobacteria bacterium]
MFAALALVASLSTPSTLPPPTAATQPRSSWAARAAVVDGRDPRAPVRLAQNTPTPDPNAADHVQTPLEQYFSYQLSPAALPAVKEGQFLSLLLGYLCAPACGSLWGPLVAVKGAEMNGDLAATWLISMLGWSAVAAVTVVGMPLLLAVPYLATTATLNAIDVQMKRKAGPRVPGSPGQKNSPPSETPPPSLAY